MITSGDLRSVREAATDAAFDVADYRALISLLLRNPSGTQLTISHEALKWLYDEWRHAVDLIEKHDCECPDECYSILAEDDK